MSLTIVDWAFIAIYFVASAIIGVWYARRGGASVNEFFLTGRSLPWWLAGTSMVATTFAADTPLAVAGLVARDGIAGNWIWWSAAFGSMLTVFFTPEPVFDYASAKKADTVRFGRFFHAMLQEGVYLPPSQFEAAFLSLAIGDAEVEHIGRVARKAFRAAA